jgi:serine/threonine-protein kinase RsbW
MIATRREKLMVKLQIPSEFGYEKVAISTAEAVARKMGFVTDKIEDLKTAVGEACANAIEHGNGLNAETPVQIILSFDQAAIVITVIDQGQNELPQIAPKVLPNEDERPGFRGMGLFLIQMLMDKIEFISRPDYQAVEITCLNPAYVVA